MLFPFEAADATRQTDWGDGGGVIAFYQSELSKSLKVTAVVTEVANEDLLPSRLQDFNA